MLSLRSSEVYNSASKNTKENKFKFDHYKVELFIFEGEKILLDGNEQNRCFNWKEDIK